MLIEKTYKLLLSVMSKNWPFTFLSLIFFTVHLCHRYYRDLLSAVRIFHSAVLCYLRLCLSSLFAGNANIISILAARGVQDVNREGLYLNITLSFADTIY